jgi:predicted RNase H-like HicB family nuclease
LRGQGDIGNYIAIAEPSMDNHSWWITFPALPGVVTAANSPGEIVRKAGHALAAAVGAGAKLPPTIEEAGFPPYDLNDHNKPLVLLVSVSS